MHHPRRSPSEPGLRISGSARMDSSFTAASGGTGSWYGIYTIDIFHLTSEFDTIIQAEWFDDINGTRTGIKANYEEVTLGFNLHLIKYLEIRPEIRGDFAS